MKKAKILRVDYVNTSRSGNGQYCGQFLIDSCLEEIYGGVDSSWNNVLRNLDGKECLVDYKILRNKFVIVELKEL